MSDIEARNRSADSIVAVAATRTLNMVDIVNAEPPAFASATAASRAIESETANEAVAPATVRSSRTLGPPEQSPVIVSPNLTAPKAKAVPRFHVDPASLS